MSARKYEVVISGVSGLFPECDNFTELEKSLFSKMNMITVDDKRWTPGELNVPAGTGKINKVNSFDMTFFGVHRKLCEIMDPTTRVCMEQAFASICDAGVNPTDLYGTKTAVIMSSVTSETEYECVMGARNIGHAMLGHSRTMQANRLSYFLNLKGPSLTIDSSWTGGMQALQEAYDLVSKGYVPNAIVGVCSIISKPEVSIHYQGMGHLNKDGINKTFSADADGYSRSEGVVVLFIQRAEHAKRSYASILGVLSYNFGARLTSFIEFSPEHYKELLLKVYAEAGVDPSEVAFIEADGRTSKKVDAAELNCIYEIFCKNRQNALEVGCVKSNLGHTEASASLVSVVKALIALKTDLIPPNINYSSPNPDVPALISGNIKVVTEPTPLKGNIVGVSSVGLANTYGHIILKQNPKVKSNPLKMGELPPDGLPRLVVVSGREENGLNSVINMFESSPIDEERISLTHSIFKKEIRRHLFRAYTLLGDGSNKCHQIKQFDGGEKRPIWFVFSGMGSQWPGMGTELLRLPTFAKAIHKCQEALKGKDIDLMNIITSTDPTTFDTILHSFVGIAAVQIGLVDVLKDLGVEPDGIVGHSVGELGCAYADGCFTLEQMILSAYARGRASVEAQIRKELIKGKMAAVGKSYKNIKDHIPSSIEVACHNSADSCTLSGPDKDMELYINELKSKGIFAKLVNVANIAYHSRYIKPAAPALLKYLKEVIPDPKPRSERWISSSIPETSWDTPLAQSSSAEYHTNNLLSSVLFEEASSHIPPNAIVIEIAPHGLLQAILKKSLSSCTNIPLTNRTDKNAINFLFNSIGKMYLEGIDLDVANLYPKVEYPVSRSTEPVSSVVTWDHSDEWVIWSLINRTDRQYAPSWEYIDVSLSDEKFESFQHQKIHNKIYIPSSHYINSTVDIFNKASKDSTAPITIESISFKKYVEVPVRDPVELYYLVQKGSGDFEVCIEDQTIVSGKINSFDDVSSLDREINFKKNESHIELCSSEFYNYLHEMGISHDGIYTPVKRVCYNEKELQAEINWTGNWELFLDGIFKLIAFFSTNESNTLRLINSIKTLSVNFDYFPADQNKDINVIYDDVTKILRCQGLLMMYPKTKIPNIMPEESQLSLEQLQFIPYNKPQLKSFEVMLSTASQVLLENIQRYSNEGADKLNIIEIQSNSYTALMTSKILERENGLQVCLRQCETDDAITNLNLNDISNECVCIVSANANAKKAIKILKHAKQGFLIMRDDGHLDQMAGVVILAKYEVGEHLFVLAKTIKEMKKQSYSIVNLMNSNWKENLNTALNYEGTKENPGLVYAIGIMNYMSEVHRVIKEGKAMDNLSLIRFVFTGKGCPVFNPENEFYKAQLAKDTIVNIFNGGKWGNLVLTPINDLPQGNQQKTNDQVFMLSSIHSDDITLSGVGLNLTDITGSYASNKLGVLEYVGYNKNSPVLGVGKLTERNKFVADEILVWNKPKSWSNEDALSIPINYSLASYILDVVVEIFCLESMLVHNGMLQVSQAVINLALPLKRTIYVSYLTESDKNDLMKMYPMIKEENFICCNTKTYHDEILIKSNGGVNLVVNTLDGEENMHLSQKCLIDRGYFFQVSESPIKQKCSMGMILFLNEAIVHGLNSSSIQEWALKDKIIIQQSVDKAIKEGIAKPFKTQKLDSTRILNTEAVNLLKKSDPNTKICVALDCKADKKQETYLCDSNKSYVIIGEKQGAWLVMLEWLINRGAKNLSIVMKKHILTGYVAQRLNGILAKNCDVRVSLISNQMISSIANIEKFYNEINSSKELDTIFITGSGLRDITGSIDQVLRSKKSKCRVISIGDGGETVCERRNEDHLPALCISFSPGFETKKILPKLDWLIYNSVKVPVVIINEKSQHSATSLINVSSTSHLPDDIEELKEFNSTKVEKACFIEVRTASPAFKYAKELPPVFLFGGLKPRQMNRLKSRLFYPAFEARLPAKIDTIDATAEELLKDLERFNSGVFTLVANDWGGALALSLARQLEAYGKTVLVILIDAAPLTAKAWVDALMDVEDLKLIKNYLKIPTKAKKSLSNLQNRDDMLQVALDNADIDIDDKEKIKDGINMLKNRLSSLANFSSNETKVSSRCHIIKREGSSETETDDISAYCKRAPKIHVIKGISPQNMLDSDVVARTINGLVLFEYKDSAHKFDEEMAGSNILHDAVWKSTGLVRN